MAAKGARWPEQLDPGPAEWMVLEILWSQGPCTGEQVAFLLQARGRWSAGAAPALLTRLMESRLVRYEDRRRRPLRFVAAVARQSLCDELCRRFAHRHFQGDLGALQRSVQRCVRPTQTAPRRSLSSSG